MSMIFYAHNTSIRSGGKLSVRPTSARTFKGISSAKSVKPVGITIIPKQRSIWKAVVITGKLTHPQAQWHVANNTHLLQVCTEVRTELVKIKQTQLTY